MKIIFYFITLISFLGINDSTYSQETQEESVMKYLKKNGLRVYDIAYYSSSYWISTQNGVVRHDGTSVVYFSICNSGPLDNFVTSNKTNDTLFADFYNLYSTDNELWLVPQFYQSYENKLYLYKISNDVVYQYTINVDNNSSYYNIDKLIFRGNSAPILLVRCLLRLGTLDVKHYDVFEMVGENFCKKSLSKTSNEWISSYLFFNNREYTVSQETIDDNYILMLRNNMDKQNEIVLSMGKEIYLTVNSFSYMDSTMLIVFQTNKNHTVFFMNSKSEYNIEEMNIDYRDECEGCLVGNKFYNLYRSGLIEYDISNKSFKKFDFKESSDYYILNGARIKMIKNYLWCLFHKRLENKMNFNVVLYKLN